MFKTVDNRVGIWQTSIDSIKSSPIFGKGFMTYKHIRALYPGSYPTSHSHNILIELLMDFGIVGTCIVFVYLYNLFHRLNVFRKAQSKYYFSSLIVALLFGLVAHGLTDLTFLWSQTGLFYGLLICGLGPEEKLLNAF
jgi:O-antigen ligase